jgi:hypothetical protein
VLFPLPQPDEGEPQPQHDEVDRLVEEWRITRYETAYASNMDDLKSRIRALLDRRTEQQRAAVDVLYAVQWGNLEHKAHGLEGICPSCRATPPQHYFHCKLANAIKDRLSEHLIDETYRAARSRA